MSTPCVPQPCALHVLVARGDADRPDLSGLLSTLGDRLQRDVERGLRPLVVVPAGSPRRTVRAVRRATQAVAAHVAVVPACAPTVEARR